MERKIILQQNFARLHPSTATIVRAVYRLQGTDSVIPRYEDRGLERPRKVYQPEEEILNIVEANPGVTTINFTASK